MSEKQYTALILCADNSARSILGELLFNQLGKGRFKAYSAGGKPAGKVDPGALEWLQANGYSSEGLRSKSWDEFTVPAALGIDYIFTICDDAAGEICPSWPGHPATAHWDIPDPTRVEGDVARRDAFNKAAEQLARRIQLFQSLPVQKLDKIALKGELPDLDQNDLMAGNENIRADAQQDALWLWPILANFGAAICSLMAAYEASHMHTAYGWFVGFLICLLLGWVGKQR